MGVEERAFSPTWNGRTCSWGLPALENLWVGLGAAQLPWGFWPLILWRGLGERLAFTYQLCFGFTCILIYFHFFPPTILSPSDLLLFSEDLNTHT